MKHTYETKNITHQQIDLTPATFSHWTLKEIWEQPTVVEKSINFGGRILDERRVKLGGLDSNIDILSNINHVILLGCGTSEHSALAVQHIFKNICNFTTVQVINASEFSSSDVPKHGKTGIIMISQSGETKDLHCCFESIKEKNVITIGVVNVVDSLIAREVNCGVYCNAGREVAVASTKSFTSQVVCLSLIAIWFSEIHKIGEHKRMKIIKDLNQLSFDIENTLKEIQSQMEEIAAEFIEREFHQLFVLGKKEDESTAKEGSLKIKEITYIHAEGCSATALKHGPFALLDENMPVILIDHTEYHSKIRNTWEEVHSRCAPLYLITSDTKHIRGKTIVVNKNESFQNILNVLPLQMLAYSISVAKGINPDTPKNLAKVVTVE
jgi:glucosamine--fructose-6-phosphate aminotransferase (isomerizing)